MIRPTSNRKPIFQGQPRPPYATIKLTKRGYKITPQNSQPQIKSYIKLTDEDRTKLEALANDKNNEQE